MFGKPAVLRVLAMQGREHGASLQFASDDPHAELLTLFWGPNFDREHALRLWARVSQKCPVRAQPLLPALLAAGDCFDALGRPEQQRLRRLILRHRAIGAALH